MNGELPCSSLDSVPRTDRKETAEWDFIFEGLKDRCLLPWLHERMGTRDFFKAERARSTRHFRVWPRYEEVGKTYSARQIWMVVVITSDQGDESGRIIRFLQKRQMNQASGKVNLAPGQTIARVRKCYEWNGWVIEANQQTFDSRTD